MVIPFLRRFLIIAAAVLTVTGSLSVLYGTDGRVATLFAEVEDGEQEDERDDINGRVSEPVIEQAFLISTLPIDSGCVDIPIVSGPHNQRGPPVV